MSKFYAIQQVERTADLYIFGDITRWRWSEEDTSAWSIQEEIKDLDVDVIHVHIDSYGGEVSEGWGIYNVLREHKARIVTHADGFVASAAIYPFMAGDVRIASSVSAFFFHQVLVNAYGNADELRRAADDADKLNAIGLNALKDAGIDADRILELEKEETWLNAEEALVLGIATEIRERDETRTPSQSIRRAVVQKLTAKEQASEPAKETTQEPTPANRLLALLSGC